MKKLLLSLFVWLFSLIWFWYCDELPVITYWINNLCEASVSDPQYRFEWTWYFCYSFVTNPNDWSSSNFPGLRFYSNYTDTYSYYLDVNDRWMWNVSLSVSLEWCVSVPFENAWMFVNWYNWNCYNFEFKRSLDSSCDDPYTSLECQTQYNLIPVEDVDINYCVWNWLCPNECGSWTDLSWDLQYSNIYINSILHPWEENIFIDIPDYIQWDYSIATWNFNIYVWSWYDMDYMNSIIKINSYRPTSSDFTNIFVSGLTLIFPYIFVLLLIIFMWKLIKRVFK